MGADAARKLLDPDPKLVLLADWLRGWLAGRNELGLGLGGTEDVTWFTRPDMLLVALDPSETRGLPVEVDDGRRLGSISMRGRLKRECYENLKMWTDLCELRNANKTVF